MLNRESRTLFISGIILTVYNFIPSVSITFSLCTLITCYFYLPQKLYKYLSWMMIGFGLLICFWMSLATIAYTNNEAKLRSIAYSCKPSQLRFDDGHSLVYDLAYESTGCYKSPDCLWAPFVASRNHVHNQTVKFLVDSFGYQGESGGQKIPMHNYYEYRGNKPNVISCY